MRYVLGVDGGGSRTRAVLLDSDGGLCGVGMAGPSNYDDIGIDLTRQNIQTAVQGAASQACIAPQGFAAAFLGMAGVISPEDRAVIVGIAEDLALVPPAHVEVDHDIRIALAGGLAGQEGIALIAGTGSACYGRRADGREWRCGGWGSLLDDLGSAYDLGRQSLVTLIRSVDGRGEDSELSAAVMQKLGITDPDQILRRIYHDGLSRFEIAALAPCVTGAAARGDPAACRIIRNGADELALLVETTSRLLDMPAQRPLVTLIGGLVESAEIFHRALQAAIHGRLPEARIAAPHLPPVLGAGLLSLHRLGVETTAELVARLKRDWENAQHGLGEV